MIDWIARDGNEAIVGKFRQRSDPDVPDSIAVGQVDSVSNYQIEKKVQWFP